MEDLAGEARLRAGRLPPPRLQSFRVERSGRPRGIVLLCEHASSTIPSGLRELGLAREVRRSHVAFDRGALELARQVAGRLDAPLVYPTLSRLFVDCNRAEDRRDLIVEETVLGPAPGNRGLSCAQRAERIDQAHRPFHDAVAREVDLQILAGKRPLLLSIHSFTPIFEGVRRPWEVGIIHLGEPELADHVARRVARGGASVGLNVPYAPEDGVYYSLERHAVRRGLPSLMIEVRDDFIRRAEARDLAADWLVEAIAEVAP